MDIRYLGVGGVEYQGQGITNYAAVPFVVGDLSSMAGALPLPLHRACATTCRGFHLSCVVMGVVSFFLLSSLADKTNTQETTKRELFSEPSMLFRILLVLHSVLVGSSLAKSRTCSKMAL